MTLDETQDNFCQKSTNHCLGEVLKHVNMLIDWANADAEHATENDAPAAAKDDRRRVKTLTKARRLLVQCER